MPHVSWTPEKVQKLKGYAAQGMFVKDIAKALGIKRSRVSYKLKREGIDFKRAPNKYGAKRIKIGTLTFDSKLEAERYKVLKERQASGEIRNLKCQERFPLYGKDEILLCHYVADFTYLIDGVGIVCEDCKSRATNTPLFKLKKKIFDSQHSFKISIVQKADAPSPPEIKEQ